MSVHSLFQKGLQAFILNAISGFIIFHCFVKLFFLQKLSCLWSLLVLSSSFSSSFFFFFFQMWGQELHVVFKVGYALFRDITLFYKPFLGLPIITNSLLTASILLPLSELCTLLPKLHLCWAFLMHFCLWSGLWVTLASPEFPFSSCFSLFYASAVIWKLPSSIASTYLDL